ncbi:SecDF P1 head subdomain-containing protein [Salipaludibacillus sp. HK11]|uniref:SecDF P1 head subdomain-containing protein n=1 Tax=Salipaludibacillus sp. HK11 TaxID=3394320 RepID=UPI0039FC3651
MNKIINYLFVGGAMLLILTGCMTSESGEVTIQNADGEVLATTSDFAKAGLEYQKQTEQYAIALTFKDENMLEEITKSHIGEETNFYLNDELISSPRINMAITGADFIIAGNIDEKTTEQLVDTINNQ